VRIGFDTPGQYRAGLFTHPIRKRADRHEIEEFFALVEPLIGFSSDRQLDLPESDFGRLQVEEGLAKSLKTSALKIVLHPGCGADGLPREWPLENYAVLGHWLIAQYKAALFLTAGPEEKIKTQRLNKLLNGRATDLGGRLNWEGTVSLLKRMDGVVSGNTGVMHVAAALHRPQVALHGPTNPVLWGPVNDKAVVVRSSCPSCPCLILGFEYHSTDGSCMARIGVEQVKQAFSQLFDNQRGI
jgi:heptosyltransferase-2